MASCPHQKLRAHPGEAFSSPARRFVDGIPGILLLGLLAGCSGGGETPVEASPQPPDQAATGEGTPRPARVLPLPGTGSHAEDSGASRVLHWDLPQGWIEEPPASSMRLAQYRVPGPGGDGECVVFYFGPGQGGDPTANAMRWARQFRQPDGSSSLDVLEITKLEEAPVAVQLVEVTGTYDGGMTMTDQPAESQPDYMLLGAIVDGPDAPWFFKFTGPEETVRAARQPFVEMLGSIHVGG